MERRLRLRTPIQASWPKVWPAALLLAFALVPSALADHVEPETVPGPKNHSCSDFTPDDEEWAELKVDPPRDGEATSSDGRLTVTLDVDEALKVFDWTANEAIVGFVFVKAGSGGHHLYTYDPLEDADSGLTSPGEGSRNQISHISFCYSTTEPPCPDGQVMGDDGHCGPAPCPDGQVMGDDGQCGPAPCPDGETMGDDGECAPEDVMCPAGLTATPRQDGSIKLEFEAAAGSDGSVVYRADGDGDFAEVAELDAGVGEWLDTTTEAGLSYRYTVTAVFGDAEAEDCPVAEATAIPDFPTVFAAGGAVGASLLAYAFARRK